MEENKASNNSLIHDLSASKKPTSSGSGKSLLVIIIIMVILGLGTGYIVANVTGAAKKGPTSIGGDTGGIIKKGTTVGVDDTKQFPDTAEGNLKEGGIDGEGEYHLERPGGESQNVYLTSSAIDLSQFVGKKVKVWGETFAAEKAGWLMDVGKLEVL